MSAPLLFWSASEAARNAQGRKRQRCGRCGYELQRTKLPARAEEEARRHLCGPVVLERALADLERLITERTAIYARRTIYDPRLRQLENRHLFEMEDGDGEIAHAWDRLRRARVEVERLSEQSAKLPSRDIFEAVYQNAA